MNSGRKTAPGARAVRNQATVNGNRQVEQGGESMGGKRRGHSPPFFCQSWSGEHARGAVPGAVMAQANLVRRMLATLAAPRRARWERSTFLQSNGWLTASNFSDHAVFSGVLRKTDFKSAYTQYRSNRPGNSARARVSCSRRHHCHDSHRADDHQGGSSRDHRPDSDVSEFLVGDGDRGLLALGAGS